MEDRKTPAYRSFTVSTRFRKDSIRLALEQAASDSQPSKMPQNDVENYFGSYRSAGVRPRIEIQDLSLGGSLGVRTAAQRLFGWLW